MPRGQHLVIQGRANRLIVFRATKRFMEAHGRCPNGPELASITGIGAHACDIHLKALAKADGLPLPVPVGKGSRQYHSGFWDGAQKRRRGYQTHDLDPFTAPVDRLMGAS